MSKINIKKTYYFIKDLSLNILSNILVIGIAQLVIYPMLAKHLGDNKFGVFLSIIGIQNLITSVLGGALNNTRLIREKKYNKYKIIGDFNILLILSVIISIILSIGVMFHFRKCLLWSESLTMVILSPLLTIRVYLLVFYRMLLRFDYLIKQTGIVVLGYLIGIVIFKLTGIWGSIFIFGESLGIIYIVFTSKFIKEGLKKTILFKETSNIFLQLSATNIIGSSLNYLDRLIIFPVLGAESVSLYYISSVIGKMISFVATPLSSIILSHVVKINKNQVRKVFIYLILGTIIFLILSFVVLLGITPLAISILYPNNIESVKKYYILTNIIVILQMVYIVMRPILIRFCPTVLQLRIQGIALIIYVSLSLILMTKYGLLGYCYSGIITQLFLVIATLIVIRHNLYSE